jgi:tetratricopeptide (TPR) repeat protein
MLLFLRPQSDRVSFRLITVRTEAEAAELRARILMGESFAALAREHSIDASAASGGFAGVFAPGDLRDELRTALSSLASGQISPVLKIGGEFVLLQPVTAEEADWLQEDAQGADWLQKGRYVEAIRSLSKAVQLAEKFGVDDDRLAQSLNGLAEAYRLQNDYAGAAAVYGRILSTRWGDDANKGSPAVADLVDQFADVLTLAYFRGPRFQDALRKYQDALNTTPVSEALYLAMSAMLVQAELTAEAADVLERAIRAFPSSRRIRYREAEMQRDAGKMRKALEAFQQASVMKPPPGMSPERDRLQLSFIYQRIGGINTDLADFDAAIAAYNKALEISPDNADARLALGDLYLRRGRHAEALAEYMRVLATHSNSALPHYRIAEANLQMGKLDEAAASAETALNIDPGLHKARYVKGVAQVRMGLTAEGEKQLEEYRRQQADAQEQVNTRRDVIVANRGAAALALEGHTEEAIGLFRKSIEAHPRDAALRLNYALALEISGREQDAALALQDLLARKLSDDFLIYKSLARVYSILKDDASSNKYRALYIRRIDGALEEELQ